MVNDSSSSVSASRPRPSQVEALRSDLDRAQEQLSHLAAEYEALLADRDVIQEDRDSAGQAVEHARASVARIEMAIARVEDGTYGRCVRCGAEIPGERLEALPDAETCVSCS
jgi:DnaK suppressor protein